MRPKKNEAAPVREIGRAIGASRSAATNVLYRTHREFFQQHDVPGSDRLKTWSLKPDVFQRFYHRLRGQPAPNNSR